MNIIGLSSNDRELLYTCMNYIYVQEARKIPKLCEIDFRCWLSEAGHFVIDLGNNEAAAVNLFGYKVPLFTEYLFPRIRAYSFYDTIKYLAEQFYDTSYEKLYSTNIDKEKHPHHKPHTYQSWLDDIVSSLARYDENLLYNATFKAIEEEGTKLAFIVDASAKDVEKIHEKDGRVIHLQKEKSYGGKVSSVDLSVFDYVVDARKINNFEVSNKVYEKLGHWELV